MSNESLRPETEWRALRDLIARTLDLNCVYDARQRNAYWLSDEHDPGWYIQFVTFRDLRLLRPETLTALQSLLADYDDWVIEVRVSCPDEREDWPEMVVEIDRDRIVDRLRHDLLPEHIRELRFGTPVDEVDAEVAERVKLLMKRRS
jgi:hypothetical protein